MNNGSSADSQRILVTGGTGFLGQRLVSHLLAQGERVRILARPLADGRDRRSRILQGFAGQGAELAWGDLTDLPAVRRAVQGVSQVFHLAGRLFVWGAAHHEYVRVHVHGTRSLLRACAENGPLQAVVHCSSTGVLGPTGLQPLDEMADLRPSNIYEATKAEGEQLALRLGQEYGLPVVAARPGLAYGPGDLHLLGWYRLIQRGLFRVVGRGDNLVHPIYVDDLVRGLLLCAARPHAAGRVYHLVGEQPVSMRGMADEIAQAVARPLGPGWLPYPVAYGAAALLDLLPGLPREARLLTRSRVRFMTQNRVYSGERARQELGFIPQVDLKTGLRHTVDWYRSEGLL